MGWKGVTWIHMDQYRDKCRSLLNTVLDPPIPYNMEDLLNISELTLFHERLGRPMGLDTQNYKSCIILTFSADGPIVLVLELRMYLTHIAHCNCVASHNESQ